MPTILTLLEETQALLRDAPRQLSYVKIAQANGLSVAWLSEFAKNKNKDYGIKKVQKLNDYLKSHKN